MDVNLVGGKAVDDLMERVLERSAVMRKEDLEAATSVTSGGRFALGVVEVAVGFSTERRRAATACEVGRWVEDVLTAIGCFGDGMWHGMAPSPGVLLAENLDG